MTSTTKSLYTGHRFPPELISYTVWLSFRFPLSLRMVPSTCWERAESWTSLPANRGAAGYAACLIPQTSCHAWKARVRSAR